MRRVIVSTAMTVDGVTTVEDWFVADGEQDRAALDRMHEADAILLGRKNFEGLAGYWQSAEGPWADWINPIPKYVASRTLEEPLEWNATLLEGEVAAAVRALKESGDGNLMTYGCGEFTRTLLADGLVDELWFWLHPALWGPGERPFGQGERLRLRLVGSETYDSGVVLLRYAPGELETIERG
jgi:dihydrofolate reductase